MTTTDLPTPRPRWWADAACAGDTTWIQDRPTDAEIELMRRACTACPVRVDCLLDALATERPTEKRVTMRAGLTAEERGNPDAVNSVLGTSTWKPRQKKMQWEWTPEDDELIAGSSSRDDEMNAARLGRTTRAVAQRRVRLARLARAARLEQEAAAS